MSNKPFTLETQTRYLWVIFGRANSPLTKDFTFYYERLKNWCDINSTLYAFIGHDKDIDDEGNPKFRHIHALIVLKDTLRPRLITSLNRLANVVEIEPTDIDIEPADNLNACVRYCIHRGYPLKHQYDVNEMITNISEADLESFLNTEEVYFTANYLINLITICNCSVLQIAKQVGLKNYLKYRNFIKDVISELTE